MDYQESKDRLLVEMALSGNRDEAFELLVEKYHKRLINSIAQFTGDLHKAEDLAQKVWIKAFRALAALKDPNRFYSWLFTIAQRESITWIKEQINERTFLPCESPENIDSIPSRESKTEKHGAIADFLRKCSRVLSKRLYVFLVLSKEGCPDEEIANILSVKKEDIKNYRYKVKKQCLAKGLIREEEIFLFSVVREPELRETLDPRSFFTLQIQSPKVLESMLRELNRRILPEKILAEFGKRKIHMENERHLFDLGATFVSDLETNTEKCSSVFRDHFEEQGIALSQKARKKIVKKGEIWDITDGFARWTIKKKNQTLSMHEAKKIFVGSKKVWWWVRHLEKRWKICLTENQTFRVEDYTIPESLREAFENKGKVLDPDAYLEREERGWVTKKNNNHKYLLKENENTRDVYRITYNWNL